jgi:cullin 1
MCTQKSPGNFSEQLYNRHKQALHDYLRRCALVAIQSKRDIVLLKSLSSRWDLHKIANRWMFRIFQYIDRFYVEHHGLIPLQDAGVKAFKVEVFDHVKKEVTSALLEQINMDREGELIDTSLIKKCIEIYIAMGGGSFGTPKTVNNAVPTGVALEPAAAAAAVNKAHLDIYIDEFQKPYVAETATYYKAKASSWLATDDVPTYLSKTESVLLAEEARVAAYLHSSSIPFVLSAAQNVLLGEPQARLIENEKSGLASMLRAERREDLARLYRLYERLGESGLTPLAKLFREHYLSIGLDIVKARENASVEANAAASSTTGKPASATGEDDFVQSLVDLHEKARDFVNTEFKGHTSLQKALKDAFEQFINKETPDCKLSNSEMIATFADKMLKSSEANRKSDVELDAMYVYLLRNIYIYIYKYFDVKFVFYYYFFFFLLDLKKFFIFLLIFLTRMSSPSYIVRNLQSGSYLERVLDLILNEICCLN